MGDPKAPSSNESTEAMLGAYTKYFPDLLKINQENILPNEQAKLEANQAVSPEYLALQNQLYKIYGPQLAATSDQINAASAKSSAQSDLDVLRGPGKDLVSEALKTAQEADPEYYKARQQVGGRLSDLLGSIDLSGNLSGGETEQLNRALAQENSRRGILNTPSQTAALSNAMTFGDARYNRQNQAKGQLAQALSVGNQFLPASNSGIDVFKVATGKTSMPNAGDSKFQGVNQNLGSDVAGQGTSFMNNLTQLKGQEMDINANRRDILDRMNEVGQALGSLS